jgi:hypothetical protein
MRHRTPLPSSFEILIDELFERGDELKGAPRSNRISFDSLEAAWSLGSNGRKTPAKNVPPSRAYSAEAEEAIGGEALLDANKILTELGLDANFTESDVALLRREFALRNHPDRVQSELRELATRRMMIANDLMDRYIARLRTDG